MMSLMRSCQEAAALLLAREDRNLRLSEKAVLRMHLSLCRACPKFERQLLLMRNALRQWRGHVNGEGKSEGDEGAESRAPGAAP